MSDPVGPDVAKEASPDKAVDHSSTNGGPAQSASKSPKPEEQNPCDPKTAANEPTVDQAMADVADADAEGDSEAETLIQSPEKQRTAAGSTADNTSVAGSVRHAASKDDKTLNGASATESDNKSRKRKRSVDDARDELAFSVSSRQSSPLSSLLHPHSEEGSDSDVTSHIASTTPKPSKKKREKRSADPDDAEEKPVRNQTRRRRPSDILPKQHTKNNSSGVDPVSSERRETRSATYPRHSSQEPSPSPPPAPPHRKEHRRGVSTQFTLGDVERKKRGRPPAIQTKRSGSADHRRRSVSSDGSDSPRRVRPALHKFTSTDHETMSPAKAAVSIIRKLKDRNGRTYLARAANNNDLELAKQKFAERPEDLNEADNAGNTPLQIAALSGFTDIVQFLLENGCEVDTLNIDRDTPLIDAIENGHVDVVKLLLDYGANPRRGNAKGEEPYELVDKNDENYDEIRALIAKAKDKPVHRRVSNEHTEVSRDGHSSRAASAASPRDSPPINGPRSPPAFPSSRRRKTGRSESTRNDLLWQANTQENLTRLAGKGDVQGVGSILNILQKAETESLIAAAKAGHEEVLQYLLAIGNAEPDPDPVKNVKLGHNTPMLAAIGRGHPEVVKLLVELDGFNPTRRLLKGKTYHEIAAERRGEQWQKEYEILKDAYDKHSAGKSRKTTSPRATRDGDRHRARVARRSHSPVASKQRTSSSPTLTHKTNPNKSPQSSSNNGDRDRTSGEALERRKNATNRKERSDVAVSSDQDQSTSTPRQGHMKRRSQSDAQSAFLDAEGTHRRRRLVTGKEHRRGKSVITEHSSDEDGSTPIVKTETRPSTALKRTRESLTPDQARTQGESTGSVVKKRRTVVESSPEESRAGPAKRADRLSQSSREVKPSVEERRTAQSRSLDTDASVAKDLSGPAEAPEQEATPNKSPVLSSPRENVIKTEEVDVGPTEAELQAQREEEARKVEEARKAEEARQAEEIRKAAEAKRLEEERIAAEKAEEERRVAEENERRKRAEEEAAAAQRKLEEEAAQKKREEEAAQKRREEEERQERIKRELEERQRRQEEYIRQQRLEYERRRREALPIVLSMTALMIDNNDPAVRSDVWLRKFLPLFTVKTSQLTSESFPVATDDLWVPNFQVAGLLATKDLNLRNYTSLEKRPVTHNQRLCLWKVSRNMLSFEYDATAYNTTIQKAKEKEEEERPKFLNMEELFWVKYSDFEDQVFRHPHLAALQPLKKQAISVRIPQGQLSTTQGPLANGIYPLQAKLTNGITSHLPPSPYGNGYAR
ncbi:hypothetical protein H2204_004921 [Knufia peltigerae]|uniref:Uncharacterized protein n=1 Tax=Knufia peltigerae TaxID=1002370 RepID=A0AA38Y6X7_9EURO|nr:hypothetical protein H2204_004921 [Knufia peltigerae]